MGSLISYFTNWKYCSKCEVKFIDNALNESLCTGCKYYLEPDKRPLLYSVTIDEFVNYSPNPVGKS